jgi:hypothetical protein
LLDDGNGDLRLKGHRITLYHVASRLRRGFSREALLEEFPRSSWTRSSRSAWPTRPRSRITSRDTSEEIDRQIAGLDSKIGLAELRQRFEAMRGVKA